MGIVQQFFLLLGLLGLGGCVTTQSNLSSSRSDFGTGEVSRDGFWHCSGHGCRVRKKVVFEDSEWRRIQELFSDVDQGAAKERVAIQRAIAELELIVGAKTGTDRDVGGSFQGFAKLGQMDCVDEMLNVASYLELLIKEKLVTKHRLGERYTNHIFKTSGWPHTATSIVEIASKKEFIIDSWVLKNGSLPFIVGLEEWSEGTWKEAYSPSVRKAMEQRKLSAE